MTWSSLKVVELKEELKKRDLPVAGKKADLVARLEEYEAQAEPAEDDGAEAAAVAQLEEQRQAEAEAARVAEEQRQQAEAVRKAAEEKAAVEAEAAEQKAAAEAEAAKKAAEERAVAEAEAAKKAAEEKAAAEAKAKAVEQKAAAEAEAAKKAEEEKAAAEAKAEAVEQKAAAESEAAKKAAEDKAAAEAQAAIEKAAAEAAKAKEVETAKVPEDDGGEASLLDDLVGGDDDDNDEPEAEAEPTPVKKLKAQAVPDKENGGKLSVKVADQEKPTPKAAKSDANNGAEAAAPAVEDKTCALRIDNFVRPFTENMVRKMLSDYGTLKSMWMPSIKTHCFAIFETKEAAEKCRQGTHGIVWPEGTGRKLTPKFVSEEEAEDAITAGTPRDGAAPRGRGADRGRLFSREEADLKRRASKDGGVVSPRGETAKRPREAAAPLTLDELFKKTATKPNIYWLPLSKEEVDARKARRAVLKAQMSADEGEKAKSEDKKVEDRPVGRKRSPERSSRRSPEKRRRDDSPPRRRSRDRSLPRRR